MVAVNLTVADYRAGGPWNDVDDVTILDTDANIASLTPEEIAALAGVNVDAITASDGTLALTVAQFTSLGTVAFTPGNTVTIVDTGANLNGLSPALIADFAARGGNAIDASDDALSIDIAQLVALGTGNIALNQDDVVTLAEFSAVLNGPDPAAVAALAGQGVDIIDSRDDQLTYSAAAFNALGTVTLTSGDDITLADTATVLENLTSGEITNFTAQGVDHFALVDTGANLALLTPDRISALATKGVSRVDATDDAVTLDAAQVSALGVMTFDSADAVTLADNSTALNALGVPEIGGLAGKGVDILDSNDNLLTLSVAEFDALGTVQLTGGDVVTIADTAANLGLLTSTQIATMAAKGIDIFDSTDGFVSLDVAKLGASGAIVFAAPDAVTIADSGAVLGALSAGQIAALADKNVDSIDATDNVLNLSVAQFNALGAVKLVAGDTVTLADAGATLSSLAPAEIATLAGKGVDVIDASDNVLSLTLAQFAALGSVQLTPGDSVTLTDSGAVLSGLSASQIGALGPQGIDAINASGVLTLTTAQYDALGIPLFGGTLSVSGTNAGERIAGTAGNDTLKGLGGKDLLRGHFGDDKLFGGLGNDTLTGDQGRDAFAFDKRPNKKTNVDKITDFNVKYDSVYLDNAVFTKLGKGGSEASPKKLSKAYFTVGSEAKDRNDYVIYDKKKGILYYDQDGSGSKAQVEVATLKKNLKITYHDFFVI